MDAQLRAAIQQELRALAASAPTLGTQGAPKLYELYILSCLVKALRGLGATFEVRDSADQPSNALIFRLAPGLIYSPVSAPGFILVRYKGSEYEIQNGLRVLGHSDTLHELDVCLIKRREAQRCRQNSVNPSGSKVKFIAECKFYGNRLPLGLGREYLGLCTEYSLRVKTIVSNVGSNDIHSLVSKHKGTENFEVSPINANNTDRFVSWLENELRNTL